MILNSLYAWEESAHPWMPVAHVHIDSIHEEDPYGYHCLFEITNRPDCIGLIEPISIYDPPSLEYLRVGGVIARRARLHRHEAVWSAAACPDLRPVVSYPDEQASPVTADDVWMDARLPQDEAKSRARDRTAQLERARGLYQFTSDGRIARLCQGSPGA